MPLAPSGGPIAIVPKHLGDRGAALRHGAGVAIPVIRQLGNLSAGHTVVVASSQQGRARGRTHRRGVKPVVGDPFLGDAGQDRRVDLPTICIGLGRADVVNQENQNVRRILRQMTYRRQRTISGLCMVRSAVLPDFLGGNGSSSCACANSGTRIDAAVNAAITGEFFFTISDFIVVGLPL